MKIPFPEELRFDLANPHHYRLACEWDGFDPSKKRFERSDFSKDNPIVHPEVMWKDPMEFFRKYNP
jgi:hypothetical protein